MSAFCPACGIEDFHVHYSGDVAARMKATNECFTCAFWEIRCAAGEPIVIEAHVYGIGREPGPHTPRWDLGMGGRRFDIEFFDGRRVTTHNLWSGGEIPERYRSRLPDTARFLGARKAVVGEMTCWDPSPESDPPHGPYEGEQP